ncbi:hypothetical protein FGG78_33890 [Thioclava sp. BHET1]|nr:hypothetical protein FGG78_33890 [Thioclava sp. BHET1]
MGQGKQMTITKDFRELRIGDVVQLPPKPEPRGAQRGARSEPSWYAVSCMSGKEREVKLDLEAIGVDMAWYPIKVVRTRIARGRRAGQILERKTALVRGYVLFRVSGFAQWDIILDRKHVTRALGGAAPVRLCDSDIERMEQTPKLLQDMADREREAATIRPGDTVRVVSGAFRDFTMVVRKVNEKTVSGEVDIFGRPTPVDLHPLLVSKVRTQA